ncbi:IS5 family transposase [Larkinella insperata]|uniref:IS5 family transposase n=1 Tax=Larkinella insperata TaxID=332158 RepID=A0ABW3Q2N1_9BACT|nr:IS5 family transposase [Larkinella insperata]
MIYPTDLTDSQWQVIQQTLPAKIGQRKRKQSIRAIINGILYVVKGGISWRMMPHDLPDWRLVYYYFRQWASQGLVQQIHDQLVIKVRLQTGREASPSLGLIDSQSVKTMSVTTMKGYDGNKHLTGRKRFILVDVLGLVLALRVTSANVGERAGALLLFARLGQRFTRLKTILADQGFDGVNFLATIKATYQLSVEVVCGVLGVKGFQVLPKRWIVGRTFGWWAFHRRLAKDYEVKGAHAEAVIYWTMIRLMSRKIRETQS